MRIVGMSSALWLMAACQGEEGDEPQDVADSDADTDSDSDSDSDTDSDTDTDSDADTDLGEPDNRLFDDEHVLVIPDHEGLHFMASDGSLTRSSSWTQLLGSCDRCGGEGSSADGDGLLVAFTTNGFSGGIARIDLDGTLDFRLDGFSFPHDAIRDPADDTIIVPETFRSQITWVAGDGSSGDSLRSIGLGAPTWQFDDDPNGLERIDAEDGRTYLVESVRGGNQDPTDGKIRLWDITDPASLSFVWEFPAEGSLYAPHCPILREHEGQWWLIYAHSNGVSDGGSVGLAVTDDVATLPAYVADLVPAGALAPFDFLRGVELTADGWLYLTDSGPGQGLSLVPEGRVMKAPMPSALAPTGASGGAVEGQVLVDLEGMELLLDGLTNPFEGWLWKLPQ
jgi:hypothetical protein